MPYKYNPFTGNLDFYEASSASVVSDITTDSGTVNPVAGEIVVTGGSGLNTSGSGNVLTINLDSPIAVSDGGTGRTSLTDGAILVGDATNQVELIGPLTDGQLLIGDTAGVSPVAASLTAPAAGVTITGGAGSITFALADDLAGLEAITGTGLAVRSASDTYVTRDVDGTASRISVSNGDGIAGNPTIDIDASYVGQATITTLGTISTGTWEGTTIAVDQGGTGQTSYTDGQLLIGNSTGNTLAKAALTAGTGITVTNGSGTITIDADNNGTVTSVSGTANRISIGGTAADPVVDIDAAYVGQATITTLGTVTTGTWNGDTIAVANGGTGATTLGDGYVLLGSGTGAITALDVTAKGSLLVGDGTTDPVALAVGTDTYVLTADSGEASGVKWAAASGGGLTWNEETGTSASMAVNNGYIANNASLVTLTIPTTAAVGDIVRVVGKGAGGWRIAQNASEIIHFLGTDTTTGTGGRLDSTTDYDAVELLCTVANTEWTVISSMGNITIT